MKLSRNGINVLTARYRAVLRKCVLINMGLFCFLGQAVAGENLERIILNGDTVSREAEYKGFIIDLYPYDDYLDSNVIDVSKSVAEIKDDLKSLRDFHYSTSNQNKVSKVELSNNSILNLDKVRLLVDAGQESSNSDGSIDAIVVKNSTINLTNSSLDASTDEGNVIFNTKFDNATLKLVNSELPIDGDVSFVNKSKLSVSSPNYFSKDEMLDMFQDDDNAQKIAEALKERGPNRDQFGNYTGPLWVEKNVELNYTNADGSKGTINTDDLKVEQIVEVMRLTIDDSELILGDSDNPEDRAVLRSDSQIFIKNGSQVTLNNRAVLSFDYQKYVDEDDVEDRQEVEDMYGKASLTIDNSSITLNDNSQLNAINEDGAETVIKNHSKIVMNDSSKMNLEAVTIEQSQIQMNNSSSIELNDLTMEKSKIKMADKSSLSLNNLTMDKSYIVLTGEKTTDDGDERLNIQDVSLKNSFILGLNNVIRFAGNVDFSGLFDPATAEINGNLTRDGYDDEITYNLNSGTLKYTNDTSLYDEAKHTHEMDEARTAGEIDGLEAQVFKDGNYALNAINFNGGTLDIANGKATDIKLGKLTLSKESNLMLDADLAGETMDRFVDTEVEGDAKLHISKLNLVSDAKNEETVINFTQDENLLKAVDYTGEVSGLTALSPVYAYDVAYDEATGDFTFTRGGGAATADYNPALYAASVAGRTVDFLQYNIANSLFSALSSDKTADNGAWVSVIGVDDDVDFKHFETVDSELMSVIGGVTSNKIATAYGEATYGVYAGYLNGEQKFSGNKLDQDGGYIGLGAELKDGATFVQGTVNTGFIRNEDKHSFGNDKFDTYWTGVALKGGYDYKLDETTTLQPNIYTSYTFVNTENYTSKSGVRVKNDNLHLWEIAPGVKLSKSFENGLSGFAQAKYAFVTDNGGDASAQGVTLPNISTKNYVEYGVGVDKTLSNAWSLSASLNRRDGGREGFNGSVNLKYEF